MAKASTKNRNNNYLAEELGCEAVSESPRNRITDNNYVSETGEPENVDNNYLAEPRLGGRNRKGAGAPKGNRNAWLEGQTRVGVKLIKLQALNRRRRLELELLTLKAMQLEARLAGRSAAVMSDDGGAMEP